MITLIPRMSEKAYVESQNGTYVFTVPMTANKAEIIKSVEAQYDGVKVKDVRTVIQTGKNVRAYRGKRQNPGRAQRTDAKKAYVTLREGSIELFKEEAQSADVSAKEKK